MSKRARQSDRDPNVAAFEMVRRLEEATSHGEDEYTRGTDKGEERGEKEKPATAEGERKRQKEND